MLHEIVFSLVGYTGQLIERKSGGFQLNLDVTGVEAHERELINRIVSVGYHYWVVASFVSSIHKEEGSEKNRSLYVRAVVRGMEELLDAYRSSILMLEQTMLRDVCYSLTALWADLKDSDVVLSSLVSIVEIIGSSGVHGTQILSELYDHSRCGDPAVERTMRCLLHHCHRVMYGQMIGWMGYGWLRDDYREFFIQSIVNGPGGSAQENSVDKAEAKAKTAEPDNANMNTQSKSSNENASVWDASTIIVAELVPRYLPFALAESILFVGRAARLLLAAEERRTMGNGDEEAAALLPPSLEDVFQLSASEFSLPKLARSIDRAKALSAQRLWQLVFVRERLPSSLDILKNMFLLSAGEFVQVFLEESRDLMRLPPPSNAQVRINNCWAHAAAKCNIPDSWTAGFELILGGAAGAAVSDSDGWRSLRLQMTPKWPLNLILTPYHTTSYSDLFGFLLTIRRTQLEIQDTWAEITQEWRGHVRYVPLFLLRSKMDFLIQNLQYYLQVDVLEAQYSLMLKKIAQSEDFTLLIRAHDEFVSALVSQCFISMKVVRKALEEICSLIQSFCGLIQHSLPDAPAARDVERISKGFQRQASFLFTILSGVSSHQAAPHLAQLLLRVDYNQYYSQSFASQAF